jgi:hypothetical protein
MARRKVMPAATSASASTPAQQDEADIVAEIGATPSEDESGDLEIPEEKLHEVGAVDAESVLENRRVAEMVGKKRSGQQGVQFNVDNVIEKYEGIIKFWPPNTMDILVKRTTGTPVQRVIQSRPRSGADLYAAIMAIHGRYEEAEYDVRFFDSNDKQRRGTGRITLPDTRDTPPMPQPQLQGQPPMSPYYPPQPGSIAPPAAPSTDPVAMMRAMFEMVQQMQRPPAAVGVPAPVLQQQPAVQAPPSTDPVAMMQQMFRMFQEMQAPGPVVPQPVPAPTPASFPGQSTDPMAMMQQMFRMFQEMTPQTAQAPQVQPQVVVAAPPSTDPLAVMQQAFAMFQKMQQPAAPPQAQAATPPVQTPPGMFHVPGFGFVPAERLFQALGGTSAGSGGPGPGPGFRPPYGERPQYGGSRPYYPGTQGHGDSSQQTQQQQRPQTVAEQFREATSVVEMAVSMAERFRGGPAQAPPERDDRDDDNPVRVVDVGGWPVIVDRKDGSARKWETGVANFGNVLKWLAEQREAIQKSNTEREAKQRRQQLPPGYVKVTTGYQPPAGYVAVPVDQLPPQEEDLPQPPEHMPPPMTQQEEAPRNRTWGAPSIPGDGG